MPLIRSGHQAEFLHQRLETKVVRPDQAREFCCASERKPATVLLQSPRLLNAAVGSNGNPGASWRQRQPRLSKAGHIAAERARLVFRQTCPATSARGAQADPAASLAGLHQRQHRRHRAGRQALGHRLGKETQHVVQRARLDRHGIDSAALAGNNDQAAGLAAQLDEFVALRPMLAKPGRLPGCAPRPCRRVSIAAAPALWATRDRTHPAHRWDRHRHILAFPAPTAPLQWALL